MIETSCSSCGRTLKVADEHAGKQAQCPVCGALTRVPDSAEAAEPKTWRMRTPDGRVYGPIGRTELERWFQQGRIADDCQLQDGEADWQPAAEIFPQLAPQGPVASGGDAGEAVQAAAPNPSAATTVYFQPHRGGLILTLGVLCWVTCPFFAIAAWIFGTLDEREMRAGRVDPTGLASTQIGMVLGMVNSIVWMLTGLIAIIVVLLLNLR